MLEMSAKFPVFSPQDVYTFIVPQLEREKGELAILMMRDVKGAIFHSEVISMGTLSEVLIHSREVFHEALEQRAYSVILVHNHPSGDPLLSRAGIELSKLLVSGGKILDTPFYDHLIIGRYSYVSMWERGYIETPRY